MELEKIRIYQTSMNLGDKICELVMKWKLFERDTIGKQLVRSVNSVSSNISEGIGRYHFKDKKNFCYFARGSLYETRTWMEKAKRRKLIDQGEYDQIVEIIRILGASINSFINSIGKTT